MNHNNRPFWSASVDFFYNILSRAKNEPFLLSHFQNDSMLVEGPNCIIHVVDPRDPQWGTIMWQEIRKQCGVDSRSNNQRPEAQSCLGLSFDCVYIFISRHLDPSFTLPLLLSLCDFLEQLISTRWKKETEIMAVAVPSF